MRVIITGATGMLGKGVLLECLDSNEVTDVLSISRKETGIKPSSKLYRRILFLLGWPLWLIKLFAPRSVVDTAQI